MAPTRDLSRGLDLTVDEQVKAFRRIAQDRFGNGDLAVLDDLIATVQDTFGSGDRVCARVQWSGTHSGDFAGLPPTGRAATWEGFDIARFADGKVVEHWGRIDRLGLRRQLTGSPAAPA